MFKGYPKMIGSEWGVRITEGEGTPRTGDEVEVICSGMAVIDEHGDIHICTAPSP